MSPTRRSQQFPDLRQISRMCSWDGHRRAWMCKSVNMMKSARGQVFAKTNRWGIPWVALGMNAILGRLVYMDIGATVEKSLAGALSNMTAIAGLSNWFAILVTYVRFRKGLAAQGMDRKMLPFASALQPYAAWWAIFPSVTVCFFSAWSVFPKGEWDTAMFVTNYLLMMLFPVMYLGKRLWSGVRFVRPEDMDFKTGLEEVLEASYDEESPGNWVERVWAFLGSRLSL